MLFCFVSNEVLNRNPEEGGITIDNQEDIILVRPGTILERETQTDLTTEQVIELIQQRDVSRDRLNEANDTINNLQTNLTVEQEAHQHTQTQSIILQAAIVALQNQINNLTTERDNRPNISLEDYVEGVLI